MVESSPSRQRRPPYKTTKRKTDEAAAWPPLLTYLLTVRLSCPERFPCVCQRRLPLNFPRTGHWIGLFSWKYCLFHHCAWRNWTYHFFLQGFLESVPGWTGLGFGCLQKSAGRYCLCLFCSAPFRNFHPLFWWEPWADPCWLLEPSFPRRSYSTSDSLWNLTWRSECGRKKNKWHSL